MSALVSITDLRIHRENKITLDIDQLSIEKNRVTALVGPNGSGKTTLLLAIARLLKVEKGHIIFDGQPMESIPILRYRRRIGLVMQDALLLDRSVYENVTIGLRFHGLPKPEVDRRVSTWLDRLKIYDLRTRNATKISGGEAQRVALARALVLQPDLLLLDEPFRSLDESAHSSLLADLKILLPQINSTTIFTTHSIRDIRELADEKISLTKGNISH